MRDRDLNTFAPLAPRLSVLNSHPGDATPVAPDKVSRRIEHPKWILDVMHKHGIASLWVIPFLSRCQRAGVAYAHTSRPRAVKRGLKAAQGNEVPSAVPISSHFLIRELAV